MLRPTRWFIRLTHCNGTRRGGGFLSRCYAWVVSRLRITSPRSRHSHPGSKTSYHQRLEMRDFPRAEDRSATDASPPITSPSIRALFGPCHHGPAIPASDPLLRMKARKAQHHLSLTLNTAFLTRKPNAPDVHYSDGVSVTAAPVVTTGAERIKNHHVCSAQAVR